MPLQTWILGPSAGRSSVHTNIDSGLQRWRAEVEEAFTMCFPDLDDFRLQGIGFWLTDHPRTQAVCNLDDMDTCFGKYPARTWVIGTWDAEQNIHKWTCLTLHVSYHYPLSKAGICHTGWFVACISLTGHLKSQWEASQRGSAYAYAPPKRPLLGTCLIFHYVVW